MTHAITSTDTSRSLLIAAAGGVISGILTPLLPALIDHIVGLPGQLRISLIAVPFAVLVFILVRRFSANPLWAAGLAAIVTMVAFVCAVMRPSLSRDRPRALPRSCAICSPD